VNIQVVRVFTQIRKTLTDNIDLRLEVERIKKKVDNHSKNIKVVFQYLDEFLEERNKPKPRKLIGFKTSKSKK